MSMIHSNEELAARAFAASAHGDQKYGSHPYTHHLTAVRAVLSDFGLAGDLGVAAWLHDVLEDTETTAEQLELAFGASVTKLVWAVTGVGHNRKDRNACAYSRMAMYPRAVVLKLADRIANAESSARNNPNLLAMYRREYAEFKKHLVPLGRLLDESDTVEAMWARLDKTLV